MTPPQKKTKIKQNKIKLKTNTMIVFILEGLVSLFNMLKFMG